MPASVREALLGIPSDIASLERNFLLADDDLDLIGGTIVFETRQWLQDGLCRHQCAKRYSGFPPTSLRWSATSFWPMMI